MKHRFRLLALVLVGALLCACLTGCAPVGAPTGAPGSSGTTGAPGAADGTAQAGDAADLTYAQRLAAVKQSFDSDVTEHLQFVQAWYLQADTVWALGYASLEDAGNGEFTWALAQLDTTGRVTQTLPLALPTPPTCDQTQEVTQEVCDLLFDADGAPWVLLRTTLRQRQPDDTLLLQDWHLTLCRVGTDGQLSPDIPLQLPQRLMADNVLLPSHNAFLRPDGQLWLALGQYGPETGSLAAGTSQLLCFAPDGSCRWQLGQQGWVTGLAPCGEDGAAFSALTPAQDLEVTSLYLLQDTGAAQPTVERQPLEPLTQAAFSAGGDFDQLSSFGFLLDGSQDGLTAWGLNHIWHFSLPDGDCQKILSLREYGLSKNTTSTYLLALFQVEEGRFLAITREDGAQPYQFHQVAPGLSDPSLLAGRQTVTLGVMGSLSQQQRQLVAEYNFSAQEVYVQVADYSDQAAADAGLASGRDLLGRDIALGKGPDILVLQNDASLLAARGLLLDLYPYLDADPELEREQLLPGLLTACEYEGQLTSVAPAYLLYTAAGDPTRLGDTPGWTWQQYREICAADPSATPPIFGQTRSAALSLLLRLGGGDYLDVSEGRCDLQAPGFVQLLQDSAAYPAQTEALSADPKQALTQGDALLSLEYLTDFRDLLRLRYQMDGDFVLKGLPGGGNGAAFMPALQMGIYAGSQAPDAAWQFIRYCLLPPFQDSISGTDGWYGLPIRLDSLQKRANAAQQPAVGTVTVPGYLTTDLTNDQLDYWRQGVLAEDCQQLLDLLLTTDRLATLPLAVQNIITEEAEVFYNGQRTAEEAAKIMQDRVQTYLNEQG